MKAAQARVLLTGAGGGIGQAMAQRLREAGATVLGVGRRPAPTAWPAGLWLQADITSADGQALITQAAADAAINVVVHAAGLPAYGALADLPAAQMQAVLQTNLLAPMQLSQALLPQLLRQPQAQLVFVGSALGRIGLPGFSVYGASKAGLHGFAEALRRELAGTSVRVQTLGPRSTRTGFNGAAVEAYNHATGTAMDSPEAVAEALLQLIEGGRAERFLGFPERLAVRLNGALGAALDGSFTRHRQHLARTAPATPHTRTSA